MNKIFYIFLFSTFSVFAQSTESSNSPVYVYQGFGLGTSIAVAISWSRNKSIFFAILHGIFSWFYVAYYYFNREKEEN
ncbi:MAG: hypothetical protein LCH67_08005 [Bacteroidetes bacterium]|nr:hypothetical protein [Bacteroidota bacterium]